ncbi:hypothetical protein [Paludisphaera soli]|uniref:hypothetical protein n=1 Tax=Paludisphaera soli TaxID=2712865 RepID=UPI0013EB9B2F|nr:hypothetical protein [Paludisphaera soli]
MPPESEAAPSPPVAGSKARRRPRGGWSFGLGHLMSLVVAVALAYALVPVLKNLIKDPNFAWGEDPADALYLIAAELTFWTFLLAVSLAAGGRRGLRRATRTYGGAATLAAVAALGFQTFSILAESIVTQYGRGQWSGRSPWEIAVGLIIEPYAAWPRPLPWLVLFTTSQKIAVVVVAAWAVLALSGRGRRPSGWLDLTGLLLGAGWVAWAFAHDYTLTASFY